MTLPALQDRIHAIASDARLIRSDTVEQTQTVILIRLRSRLGLQAVEQVGCRDEHLPELAVHTSAGEAAAEGEAPCRQRPFWLLPEPQPLRQRHEQLYWQGPIALVYGPERIEDNWWQAPVSRDYFIARGRQGEHYWVYRDRLHNGWYLHGIFA